MTDQYAVFGNPIAHSKSPVIHAEFAKHSQQDMQYVKTLVPEQNFAQHAQQFFNDGGKGLNITVPFKIEAYEFADQLSQRARQAGAVNTLAVQADGTILGDNTDGIGMVTDIRNNLGWALQGARILVLGAGGAVRGVLSPLLEQQPELVVIANRTEQKAEQLAKAFGGLGNIQGCGFDKVEGIFDVIINGTSASLSGDLPPLPTNVIAAGGSCYDMMYSSEPTVFMQWAQSQGCTNIADGLGMLVEQAAAAFTLWRGVTPDTSTVIAGLRNQTL